MTITNNTTPQPSADCSGVAAQELGFERMDLDKAITRSEELLSSLVPGVCRRHHVMAFCQQAPIARYLASACPGGAESNPWTAKAARKFVKLLRNRKLTPQTIIQIAHQATLGRHTIRCRLEQWIAGFNDREIDNVEFDLTSARLEASKQLIVGHFGSLFDTDLQDDIRQNEVADIETQLGCLRQFMARLTDCNGPSHILYQVPMALRAYYFRHRGFPSRRDFRDKHKDVILKELATRAFLRRMAPPSSEDEMLDIWGVTPEEITNAIYDVAPPVHTRCDVFNIPYEIAVKGLGVWDKYRGMGYSQ